MSGEVGMAMDIVGAVNSAYGQQELGAAQATAANTNASIMDNNARAAVEQASQDAELQQRQSFIAIGQEKALYGASGVSGDSGSVLDVLASSAANAELERQTIAYKGRLKALGYATQAELDRSEGRTAMTQADEAASATMMKALGGTGAKAYGASGGFNFSGSNTGLSDAPNTDSTMGDALP